MRLALLGGTFNPIHIGHLFVAEQVRISLGYERIVFVPSYRPAHKNLPEDDRPEHRLAMAELAVRDNPAFEVEDCEISRRGVSYTMDTIRMIAESRGPEDRIGLIIGADLVAGLPRWKNVEELVSTVRMIIARRGTAETPPLHADHVFIDNPFIDISSSDIRRRVAENGAYRYLVPERVYDYIREHGLYRRPGG